MTLSDWAAVGLIIASMTVGFCCHVSRSVTWVL